MGIKVALEHRTSYRFDRLVTIHPHVVRLRPAPHSRTTIESYSLTVEPANHFVNWQQDPFGNFMARLVFPERARELTITVGLVADLAVVNPFDFFIEDYAEHYGFTYPAELAADLEPYLRPVDEGGPGSGPGPLVRGWLKDFTVADQTRIVDFLVQINAAVQRSVGYSVRMEPGVQTPDHTLSTAIGSCRDSAWLLVSLLRELGLAARFVSGYLVQLTSDVPSLDGPSGPAADFTDLHAWAEVYIPGAGWIGMDPTSGLFAGEGHIPLSATPHPSTAAAISGSTGIAQTTLEYSNVVRRVHEDPRVTLPYISEQWVAVQKVGQEVDRRLTEADVRLTMGGEPTFVSIDDLTAPEWTIAADGPQKRERAGVLAQRLRGIYAANGIVHRGQGKWYPGEPLPRWQIVLHWRADGQPLWSDPSLFADPWAEPSDSLASGAAPDAGDQRRDAGVAEAGAFAESIAAYFGLPQSQVRPAFEDPLAKLAALVRLPAGEPVSQDLTDDSPDARAELLTTLDESVETPTAFVLPLHRLAAPAEDRGDPDDAAAEPATVGWASADWRLRRGRIVLVPGDSPAGLRLPLDAISWQEPEPPVDPDPLEAKPELPATQLHRPRAIVVEATGAPTTALVIEARGGLIHVFLPPIQELDPWVELIGAIDHAASSLGLPLVLEGYPPPNDPRLKTLSVTPDPGVIEVNVQPVAGWDEQVALTTTLYEQARLSRLGTETFAVDGSHRGTGGGNHITVGGATPAESPLLRRPDLLVSLLTHWQRHPALSYLFSGQFIGPTSQAPRADEGRPESLYEMEIAFSEIERAIARAGGRPDGSAAPWVVDRALRHLLTDLTGNTHRAEFCIDKLYSPDSARGRLGLLELRGFEMPPHAQMALVQALLVRSLVSRFWDEPLRAPLIRHGDNLHGRYLLPHYVISDIAEVAADLRAHGIDFQTSWLDPFFEFRFPRLGTVTVGGMGLELRWAIEPWHVLGEEATAGGTARYVDSSVERLQVSLTGASGPGQVWVTCNGYPVPLQPTHVPGLLVAGVRYRAWQPPSSLHPTIPSDSPLVFDVVDAVSGVSLGGATYHVSHPGGRSYETPPVNAMEAESRRTRRFDAAGHSPGEIDINQLRERAGLLAVDHNAPGMLDLRRARAICR
ncbi:transglutaminase family protein [Nakamurella multipartita]|uniref:Transglutaminase domain protein n=1 Tax=Nakamurella multipartita (strain ATCC 700099 / DSM 44233 / CIP 104796 / JCM 9543 / NBRC 105858 / Y-104) TaxID=479431 RepID=C8XDV9_NAKMY|nr:transglutaminase family protein [Nakamurella multipartita]ACV79662.1 transglutaminase domain protein [Nakamurella multipartita DSM 44233]